MEQIIFKYLRAEPEDHHFLMVMVLFLAFGIACVLCDCCHVVSLVSASVVAINQSICIYVEFNLCFFKVILW